MEFEELKRLFNVIGNIPQEEFQQLSLLGYLYGRRYSDQIPDEASEKEAMEFMEYATKLQLYCSILANILNGHMAITFTKKEPTFHLTAVGKRYTEENILRKPE